MTALQATSAGYRDMADGSLRITLEFDPAYAQQAIALFGPRGTPCAVAALTVKAATAQAQAETIAKEKLTGLALLAVQWCKDEDFWRFLNHLHDFEVAVDEKSARDTVCDMLAIESRRELETDQQAIAVFNQQIRGPYMLWRQEQGL